MNSSPKSAGWADNQKCKGSLRSKTLNRGLQPMPEQLLTLEQVAEYLNVDKFTVYRLLADKELPAFKVGNQWRFKRKMIENWLLKNSNLKRKDTQ
jgi:excisionase family DNA binding protein